MGPPKPVNPQSKRDMRELPLHEQLTSRIVTGLDRHSGFLDIQWLDPFAVPMPGCLAEAAGSDELNYHSALAGTLLAPEASSSPYKKVPYGPANQITN
jgi:hypothetical protein